MRKTAKMTAALAIVPQAEQPYQELEKQGYEWHSNRQRWDKRPPATFVKTGVIDIRLRTGTGEVNEVVTSIVNVLKMAGFVLVSESVPYPDDRRGPARTARVYLQVKRS